jgi:hypothetical protein
MMGAVMKKLVLVLVLTALTGACTGPMGPTGPQGPMGDPGSAAPDGSKVVAYVACGGTRTNTQLAAFYSASQFENGNVFATASVLSAASEGNGTALFGPEQNGAANAQVVFVYDTYGTPTGGYWTFTMNRDPLGVTVTYNDSEVSGGTLGWVWQYDACHPQSF